MHESIMVSVNDDAIGIFVECNERILWIHLVRRDITDEQVVQELDKIYVHRT